MKKIRKVRKENRNLATGLGFFFAFFADFLSDLRVKGYFWLTRRQKIRGGTVDCIGWKPETRNQKLETALESSTLAVRPGWPIRRIE